MSKKFFITATLKILFIILLIHVISLFTFDKWIEYKKVSFHSAKISTKMNGYSIAFISDVHYMSASDLKNIVQELSQQKVNLLVLGGDFPVSMEEPQKTMEILSQIVTTDGIYGVEGNHDRYQKLFAAMKRYSIQPLSNSGVRIREKFYLAGVEDLWNRQPNIEQAIAEAETGDFVLLIAHNPDVSMMQNTTGVDLILSGHTHGGQITLFGLWAPALKIKSPYYITRYGQRFMSGWAKSRDGTPVYVSKGVGTFFQIPRVFARPQVVLFTLMTDEVVPQ